MNHFNFFSKAEDSRKKINLTTLSVGLAVAVLAGFFGYYLILDHQLTHQKEKLQYLETVENSPSFRRQYAQVRSLEDSLKQNESDYLFLRTVSWLKETGSTVNEALVKTVFTSFLPDSKIVKMTINGSEISLEGVAKNLDIMIRTEARLRSCREFSYVFIQTAKADGHEENGKDAVSFYCRLTLADKGGT